jgi:hypothetical protein
MVGWVPLAILALVGWVATGHPVLLLRDGSVHTRLLVACPCYLIAQPFLDARCRATATRLLQQQTVRPHTMVPLVARAHHLRDSVAPELVALVFAVALGQAALWSNPIVHGLSSPLPLTAARLWYGLVSLPLANFLLLRALWQWALWSMLLLALARRPLSLEATHGDRCGGLECLATPASDGFIWIAVGTTAIAAGSWGTQVASGIGPLSHFYHTLVALLVLWLVVAYGPLAAFSRELYTLRRRGAHEYAVVGAAMSRRFRERWGDTGAGAELLDHADPTTLHDFNDTFTLVSNIRYLPLGLRAVTEFVLVTATPLVPVVLTGIPADRILKAVMRVVFGGGV